MARNASHMGRLVAIAVALLVTAVAVFSAGGSNDAQASSAGGLPVIVPEARSAVPANVINIDGSPAAYELALNAEGRA
jgi:hypothetical protein